MNIAVLGGSFDPPHNGHLEIAKEVLKSQKTRKVILMPVGIHPFGKPLTSAKHRLTMTKFLQTKNIRASNLEIKKHSISYSIETLRKLKNQFPKDRFYWILGEDQIKKFHKWKDWQSIEKDFGVIVMPRENPVSSSEIRKKVRSKKPISALVPKRVEKYIIRHKLYL